MRLKPTNLDNFTWFGTKQPRWELPLISEPAFAGCNSRLTLIREAGNENVTPPTSAAAAAASTKARLALRRHDAMRLNKKRHTACRSKQTLPGRTIWAVPMPRTTMKRRNGTTQDRACNYPSPVGASICCRGAEGVTTQWSRQLHLLPGLWAMVWRIRWQAIFLS